MLPQKIKDLINYGLVKNTRIHRLCTDVNSRSFWIKREDEMSSGIVGSKLRKYASIIPYLISKEVAIAGIIGGPNSNNLVGLAQILKENSILPVAFMRKPSDAELKGNSLLLKLLLEENTRIYVDHSQWPEVETLAVTKLEKLYPKLKTEVLPEGCLTFEGLLGSLTLAEDVLRNENELEQGFTHIFIDSGTGLSAIGLILGLELLRKKSPQPLTIVITHIAGNETEFSDNLTRFREMLHNRFKLKQICDVCLQHTSPPTARKYGHINTSVLSAGMRVAKELGILMDPVYSVKHYMAFRKIQESLPLDSRPLFIFNGSALGLMGYQTALVNSLT